MTIEEQKVWLSTDNEEARYTPRTTKDFVYDVLRSAGIRIGQREESAVAALIESNEYDRVNVFVATIHKNWSLTQREVDIEHALRKK